VSRREVLRVLVVVIVCILRDVDPFTDMYITYAWGPNGVMQISSHTSETSGAVYVNLSEGGKVLPRMSFWMIIGHAIIGLLGLVIVLPLSGVVSPDDG